MSNSNIESCDVVGISRRDFMWKSAAATSIATLGGGLLHNGMVANGQEFATGPGQLFYKPSPDNPAADVWCHRKDGRWYVYTLNGASQNSIGVGVSDDLLRFEYVQDAFNVTQAWEGAGLYGGDTIEWKGDYYMLYSAPGPGSVNGIGLAQSVDLVNWTKHAGNPVMRYPDATWYEGNAPDGMRGGISCRDVYFIDDACTDEWVYVCFTAATGRGDYYRRGCIGLARSNNMTDWEYLPPLFAPGLYTAMEVPRICKIGTKWFLTWLHAPWYGLRTDEDHGEPAYTSGETMIHYAVADAPLGPYRLAPHPTLFRGGSGPYVIDMMSEAAGLKVTGCMFSQSGSNWFDRERAGLVPAMPIKQSAASDERLEVGFPAGLYNYFRDSVALIVDLRVNNPLPGFEDVVKNGSSLTFENTSNRIVEMTASTDREVIIDIDFDLAEGRGGIVTRYDGNARQGCVAVVDPAIGQLQFIEINPIYNNGIIFRMRERYAVDAVGKRFNLKVIQSYDYQQVFVDDVYIAAFSFARRSAGAIGVCLEAATGACQVKSLMALASPLPDPSSD